MDDHDKNKPGGRINIHDNAPFGGSMSEKTKKTGASDTASHKNTHPNTHPNTPKNASKAASKPRKSSLNQIAVALKDNIADRKVPTVEAVGRGHLAEKIIQLAFENDIKVRHDSDLVEILAALELDSPIPSEAFAAVAEILSYVYRANGKPDPFQAVLDDE